MNLTVIQNEIAQEYAARQRAMKIMIKQYNDHRRFFNIASMFVDVANSMPTGNERAEQAFVDARDLQQYHAEMIAESGRILADMDPSFVPAADLRYRQGLQK